MITFMTYVCDHNSAIIEKQIIYRVFNVITHLSFAMISAQIIIN